MTNEEKPRRAWMAPLVWLAVAAVGTLICLVVVGVAAAGSESAGVSATYSVAFPLGFLWAGALAAVAGNFFLEGGARMAAPFGCGVLGGGALLGLIVLFFVAIFPAL